MSSRSIQILAIEQKIERLQAQLDYLRRIDELEEKQASMKNLPQAPEKE